MFESQDQQLQKQNQAQGLSEQGGSSTSSVQPRPRPPQPRPPSQATGIPGEPRSSVPPNLPIGGERQPLQAEGELLTEDIFSQSDDIPVFSPPGTSEIPRTPPAPAEVQVPPQMGRVSHAKRKVVVFLLSAFIIAFFLIAGYLIYRIVQARQNIGSEIPTPSPINTYTSGEVGNAPSNNSNVVESESEAGDAKTENNAPISGEELKGESGEPTTPEVTQPETSQPTTPEAPPPPKDSDGDGLLDIDELKIGTNPNVIDTDFDGIDDYAEARVLGTNPTQKDTDQDGLSDGEEKTVGTDPKKEDTDQDGVTDYMEVKTYKSDPSKKDTDGDGYDDGKEIQNGYSPIGPGKL